MNKTCRVLAAMAIVPPTVATTGSSPPPTGRPPQPRASSAFPAESAGTTWFVNSLVFRRHPGERGRRARVRADLPRPGLRPALEGPRAIDDRVPGQPAGRHDRRAGVPPPDLRLPLAARRQGAAVTASR